MTTGLADARPGSAHAGAPPVRRDFNDRVEDVKRRAHGHWTEILGSLGVATKILGKRNGPCPLCGGTDRFQYTDRFGEGNYHCRGCGPGGGFKLLQAVTGCDFPSALQAVESRVGAPLRLVPPPASASADNRLKKLAQRIWDEATPVAAGDQVADYLAGRGLTFEVFPRVLRRHPALGYYDRDDAGRSRKVAEYPAMLAAVQDAGGQTITLHRTYLLNGRKLISRDARKVLSSGISGAAVRLYEPSEDLAICEGIETALAVRLATGKPVWAAISAGNLEKLVLPVTTRRIDIYADNDANGDFAGQACAYALARRLRLERGDLPIRQVQVFVPRTPGTDWADVWLVRRERRQQPPMNRAAANTSQPGV